MNEYPYWRKQSVGQPLFPDVEWNKPERKDLAGRLGLVGGSELGFAATAESHQTAKELGAGEVRVLLPDALRKTVPPTMTDVVFGPTNNAGGLGAEAKNDLATLANWSDVLLMIGDAGRNSQTAIIYEELIKEYSQPIVITRDAFDLLQNSYSSVLENPHAHLVISFAQAQKLFREVYYPKMLAFSMQLTQLVEALHKFTLTYPVTIMTLHSEQIIIARGGEVVSQDWHDPMRIWRGTTATRAACYLLWTPQAPLQALATSIV